MGLSSPARAFERRRGAISPERSPGDESRPHHPGSRGMPAAKLVRIGAVDPGVFPWPQLDANADWERLWGRCPSSVQRTAVGGRKPMTSVEAVISTARNRTRAPSRAASIVVKPEAHLDREAHRRRRRRPRRRPDPDRRTAASAAKPGRLVEGDLAGRLGADGGGRRSRRPPGHRVGRARTLASV